MNRNHDDHALTAHADLNNGDRADRSVGLTQPSLTTPERRRRHDSGDEELLPTTERTSRLRCHDSDDDDATLTPSIISESGERSLLIPARRNETTLSEGNVGAVREVVPSDESRTLRTDNVSGMQPHQGVSSNDELDVERQEEEGERSSRPSPKEKKARARLELASPREPDDADLPRRRNVSGSAPPPPSREAAAQDDERASRPFSEDKENPLRLELAQAREQGPEDLIGRRAVDASVVVVEEQDNDVVQRHHHAVESGSSGIEVQANLQRLGSPPLVHDDQQEFELEDGGAVQPGAFRVGGNRVRDDATAEDTIWGGIDSSEEAGMAEGADGYEDDPDDPEDDLFSAQLVDPEAERLRLESQVERMLHERLAQQPDDNDTFCAGLVVCGVDFSKRTNQVFCLLLLALAVAALIAALFAADVVGPQSSSSAAATSPSMSNPPIFFWPICPTVKISCGTNARSNTLSKSLAR